MASSRRSFWRFSSCAARILISLIKSASRVVLYIFLLAICIIYNNVLEVNNFLAKWFPVNSLPARQSVIATIGVSSRAHPIIIQPDNVSGPQVRSPLQNLILVFRGAIIV